MKQLQRVLFVLVLVVFALFVFYTYNVDNEKVIYGFYLLTFV